MISSKHIDNRAFPLLTVNSREGTVTGPRGQVRLEPKVMAVLMVLARQSGNIVSRDELLNAVWPGTVVSEHSLSRCIYQLRRQLREIGPDSDPIETLPKRGYRLLATVGTTPQEPRITTSFPDDKSIAVLPFVDMSEQRNQEYLGDGIADELTNGLAKLSNLRVVARTSAFQFKGKNQDIRSIAERLGVSTVLEGSVRKTDNRVRITAQLIDARDASHLWSASYDRELSDIFALQDEVAGRVIDALRVELKSGPAERLIDVGTRSAAAYDAFLLAMHHSRKISEAGYRQAISFFERATKLDPRFAKSYAQTGWCFTYLMSIYGAAREEMTAKAKRAFARAEELGYQDPLYPWDEIHRIVDPAEHSKDNRTLARQALEMLTAADPSGRFFEYCQLARCLTKVGIFDSAYQFYELYLSKGGYALGEVLPAENEIRWVLTALGRFDEAIDKWTQWIELEPDAPMHKAERSYVYSRMRRYADAEQDVAAIARTWPTNFATLYLLACRGEQAAARRYLAMLERSEHTATLFKAYGSLVLGNLDRGIDYLEQMISQDQNWPLRLDLARFCDAPTINTVLGHPRYQAMLRAMGLDDGWRDELVELCNEVTAATGIHVQPDSHSHHARRFI